MAVSEAVVFAPVIGELYVASPDPGDECVKKNVPVMDGSIIRILVKRIIGATNTIIIIIDAIIPIINAVRSTDVKFPWTGFTLGFLPLPVELNPLEFTSLGPLELPVPGLLFLRSVGFGT